MTTDIDHRTVFNDLARYLFLNYDVCVRFKDKSRLMRFISALMFWNKTFMTDYVTTIGRTVYFPTRLDHDDDWGTLAHEAVHALDYDRAPTRFVLGYLAPQCLGVLSVLAALALFLSPVWLLSLGFLLFLAPWPSPWRLARERRGYAVSAMAHCLRYGSTAVARAPDYTEWLVDQYAGWPYYKMGWSTADARADARADVDLGVELALGHAIDAQVDPGYVLTEVRDHVLSCVMQRGGRPVMIT